MRFSKMQGCGNDYVVMDAKEMERLVEEGCPGKWDRKALVRRLCDRHYGIGADGVLLVKKGRIADYEMLMYNPDGSRGEMCGNGIRCAGKYLWERELKKRRDFTVESMGAVKTLSVLERVGDGEMTLRVDMGKPVMPGSISLGALLKNCKSRSEMEQEVVCVSMGNPHAVLVMGMDRGHGDGICAGSEGDNADGICIGEGREPDDGICIGEGREPGDGICIGEGREPREGVFGEMEGRFEQLAPCIGRAEYFPQGTNVEFVRVEDGKHISMRVWERGVGETLACGTGACAAAYVCMQKGLTDDEITVKLIGGELLVSRQKDTGGLWLTGPAVTVFTGEINIDAEDQRVFMKMNQRGEIYG